MFLVLRPFPTTKLKKFFPLLLVMSCRLWTPIVGLNDLSFLIFHIFYNLVQSLFCYYLFYLAIIQPLDKKSFSCCILSSMGAFIIIIIISNHWKYILFYRKISSFIIPTKHNYCHCLCRHFLFLSIFAHIRPQLPYLSTSLIIFCATLGL